MSRWFRFYADAIRNPKVASLSDRDFRTWVGLLSIAAENDGLIPPLETSKRLLSMRLDHLLASVQRLASIGLIDELASGYEPHNWDKFQYKSDTSNERVTLHRQRKNAQAVTPPETETDTEVTVAKATGAGAPDPVQALWALAVAYLGEKKRPLIGKWIKKHGHLETAKAITAAQIEKAVDPVSYIEAVLRGGGQSAAGEIW